MMINKQLIGTVSESKKYIAGNVMFQWCSLAANIAMMTAIAYFLAFMFQERAGKGTFMVTAAVAAACVLIRFLCAIGSARMGYLSSKAVKKTLREKIYKKLLRFGTSYNEQINTSEVVQVAVEGVDQLEIYFGAYLPQFFYAMLAPLTLFVYLSRINLPSAAVLLICVPLIPVAIAAVQTWAKKLLSKYWVQYTALGDTFLDNLQGLTTLKIYQADEFKNREMNEEAEKFRKITMKVLTMQLNSITIMDLIAYGGAALGVIMAVTQYVGGKVSLSGCLLIILLAADFFIPMRQLGSFFHIAMNGMAASDKIFRLLDLPEEPQDGKKDISENCSIVCSDVRFSYEEKREILHGVDMKFPQGSFTAFVGESGSGKSTLLKLFMRFWNVQQGKVAISDTAVGQINTDNLRDMESFVTQETHLFHDSIKNNLKIVKLDATDDEIMAACKKASVHDFIMSLPKGYDTEVGELGDTLSGGERQRIGLARAFLHNAPFMLLDEPTSNLDSLNEAVILKSLREEQEGKTVVLVSHRESTMRIADLVYSV